MKHPDHDAYQSGIGRESDAMPDAVEQNIILLESNPKPRVRERVISALVQSRDPRAVIPILAIYSRLGYSLEDYRQQIAAFGEPAVAPLLEALSTGSRLMRCHAVQILGDIGDARALSPVEKAIKDEFGGVRCYAVEALKQLEHPLTLSLVIEALKDSDAHVRLHAIAVLSGSSFLGDERAIKALLNVRNDPDVFVRTLILDALYKHGDRRAISFYLEAMNDKASYVRWYVARELGQIKEPLAIPLLIRALKDVERSVRESAGNALLQFGEKDALAVGLLTNSQGSVSTKLDILTDLVKVRFRSHDIHVDYRSPSVEHYCQELLQKEIPLPAQEAIQEVLGEIRSRRDRQLLLRASASNPKAQELLRGAEERPNMSPPKEMLRASEESAERPTPRSSWIARFFRRRR